MSSPPPCLPLLSPPIGSRSVSYPFVAIRIKPYDMPMLSQGGGQKGQAGGVLDIIVRIIKNLERELFNFLVFLSFRMKCIKLPHDKYIGLYIASID